jgi:hypothetical protein
LFIFYFGEQTQPVRRRTAPTALFHSGIIPISVPLNFVSEASYSSPYHFYYLCGLEFKLIIQVGFLHFVSSRVAFSSAVSFLDIIYRQGCSPSSSVTRMTQHGEYGCPKKL